MEPADAARVANYFRGEPARGGAAVLLRKATLVEPLPATGQLPVRTLTFANPNGEPLGIQRGRRDVVKILIPGHSMESYSMSDERPERGEFDLTIKVYPGGACSGYLDSVAVGESIQAFAMASRYNAVRNPGSHVGLVAFGVGITEAREVAKAELEQPDAELVHLLWGARTFGDMFWGDSLAELERAHRGRFKVTRILSREDREGCLKGRIDADVLATVFRDFKGKPDSRFLAVGTRAMINQANANLDAAGFPWPASALLLRP